MLVLSYAVVKSISMVEMSPSITPQTPAGAWVYRTLSTIRSSLLRIYDWVSKPSNHGIQIIFETVHHSFLILVLDLCVRLLDTALEFLDKHLPHGRHLSYFALDTLRAMVTIADLVMVILFLLLGFRIVIRFVRVLRGGPK